MAYLPITVRAVKLITVPSVDGSASASGALGWLAPPGG